MSISNLRWHMALALGSAAAAVMALAVPAGASTGAQQTSPDQAGYTATGAQFKRAGAIVYLRDPSQYANRVARYGHSVQLWSPDVVVSVNLTARTSGTAAERRYTPSV